MATRLPTSWCSSEDVDPLAADRACAVENEIRTLFSARRFDFGGVQASDSVELRVADAVDVSAHENARLNVRVHEANIAGSSKIEVVLYTAAPTAQDPAKSFLVPTELAVIELDELLVTGGAGLLRGGAVLQLGSFVAVGVRGTQGGSVADCNAVLSAELVLRGRPDENRRGSGRRIAASPMTELDYTSLAPSTQDNLVLIDALDVRDYKTGFLALRVHDRSIGSNASLVIQFGNAFPDVEDPSVDFRTEDEYDALLILAGTTPTLLTASISGFGPFLYVRVVATQSASGGDLRATISLEFVGQE